LTLSGSGHRIFGWEAADKGGFYRDDAGLIPLPP
jgi:hypothetical protein